MWCAAVLPCCRVSPTPPTPRPLILTDLESLPRAVFDAPFALLIHNRFQEGVTGVWGGDEVQGRDGSGEKLCGAGVPGLVACRGAPPHGGRVGAQGGVSCLPSHDTWCKDVHARACQRVPNHTHHGHSCSTDSDGYQQGGD